MPRIRTIKPEFWSSPGVTEMNPWARLAFIAMWNWADDFGRGTYEPRELMGFIFPREDDMTVKEFRTHVGEIHRHVGVVFYIVDERPYFEISTWKKHQKTDPRLKQSKFPGPDEGTLIDPVSMQVIGQEGRSHQHVDVLHQHVDETHAHVGAGTGEQGNRGTGEEGKAGGSESPSQEPATPQASRSQTPSVDSLDSLADGFAAEQGDSIPYGTPEDPRCYAHRHTPKADVPPCFKCKQARDMWAERATQAKTTRQAAIDSCQWCDDRGLVETHDHDGRPVALKCHHRETPPVYEPPEPEPQSTFDPADFLNKLRERNTPDQPLPTTGTGPF